MSLEKKIIQFLEKNSTQKFKPSDISLNVGFERPKNSASTVNPTLYKLLSQGKVVKHCEKDGSKPMWQIKTAHEDESSEDSLEEIPIEKLNIKDTKKSKTKSTKNIKK
jgi:hypothetical protein